MWMDNIPLTDRQKMAGSSHQIIKVISLTVIELGK